MALNILETAIEYLAGVGPLRADTLKKELGIFNYGDLLTHFPFRYIDRTRFWKITEITEDNDTVQLRGIVRRKEMVGEGKGRRLEVLLRDSSGVMNLVWFNQAQAVEKSLRIDTEYVVFGKINRFGDRLSIVHPEMEISLPDGQVQRASTFDPVYPSTAKLEAKGLDAKGQRKIMRALFEKVKQYDVPENLSAHILQSHGLIGRYEALYKIHFPNNTTDAAQAKKRLVFEELFFLQIRLLRLKLVRQGSLKGLVFDKVGAHFNTFYNTILPFTLTNAQKRVVKEIRIDVGSGKQMNRLLQGDVGSGKTMVAFLTVLIALDSGYQSCIMAPTEILAEQHYNGLSKYCEALNIGIGFLSGSIKGKKREAVLAQLASGEIKLLVGTHAIFEDWVVFQKFGLAIIDEQHRFGVEQRSKLWRKSGDFPPHVLVMSATPIPRTLAMTIYGDLDVSVIDELPAGRKPIQTVHYTENHRAKVIGFIRHQISKGQQVYVVYPLIEESEKLDLLDLMQGHAALSEHFAPPEYQLAIVHGKMHPKDKAFEMQRFVSGQAQIMVATTVIEVGVNVPNATAIIIEHTERFGLAQLHQLRGRVGRGADQSYCVLMSSYNLNEISRKRIKTMCDTTDGFVIAEVDLALRGPGDIEGTMQSGSVNIKIADLVKDQETLHQARATALQILESDPNLATPQNSPMQNFLEFTNKNARVWSKIS